MEDTYKTLEKPAEGMFKDRNSRFLSFGYPVENTEQINDLLSSIRKKYHDARHHCYAYRLGKENELFRQNDDGEPSGTAGKPIYNQMLLHNLTNTLIVVVRYFGGTLLGTGGLINAYRSATADMINHAVIVVKYIEEKYEMAFPYEKLSTVMKLLKDENLVPLHPVYDVNCTMTVAVRRSLSNRFLQKFSGITTVKISGMSD